MWSKYPEIYEELKLIEECIHKSVTSHNKLITKVATDLVEAGGKRLRPAFVVLSAKFGQYDRQKVINSASALEILHTATLVHDDVIDHAKLRRGKVTVFEKYGPDMAVYTGDFLLTIAVGLIARDLSTDKLDLVAKAVKAICEGEVDQYQDRYNINTTILSYLKKTGRKTAVLFGAACGLGANAGRCDEQTARMLTRFGLCYGMAFQIKDDINDFTIDSRKTGKPSGKDILEGLVTLPVIYAMSKSSTVKQSVTEFLKSRCELVSPSMISDITEMVVDNGGIEQAKGILDKYIHKGLAILDSLPDSRYKAVFRDLILALEIS